jgi:hypothetical protein
MLRALSHGKPDDRLITHVESPQNDIGSSDNELHAPHVLVSTRHHREIIGPRMFNIPTVMVVGAGAGFDLEMPLGNRLAKLIADAVDFRMEAGALSRGHVKIAEALQGIGKGGWGPLMIAGRMIAEGIQYTRSIDNYVHSHSDKSVVKTVAKIAIVKTILDAERACHIATIDRSHPNRFRDEEKAHKSWLSDFFTVLQDGVVETLNLENIFDNLTIINFNYDRCVEHYLFHVFRRLYPSRGEAPLIQLLSSKLKILHPYGVVGHLPWQSQTGVVTFGGEPSAQDLVLLSEQIRTYNEEVDDTAKVCDRDRKRCEEDGWRPVRTGLYDWKLSLVALKRELDALKPVI